MANSYTVIDPNFVFNQCRVAYQRGRETGEQMAPMINHTPAGRPVSNVNVVREEEERTEDGRARKARWIRLVGFDGFAEDIAGLKHGQMVSVTGRLQLATNEDNGLSREELIIDQISLTGKTLEPNPVYVPELNPLEELALVASK